MFKTFVKIMAPDCWTGRLIMKLRILAQTMPFRFSGSSDDDTKDFLAATRRLTPRYSMLTVDRLHSLYRLSLELARSGVDGALVECGTWNGGAAAIMARASIRGGIRREIWLFDSFEGLPAPTAEDPPVVHKAYHRGWCTGSPQMALDALLAEGSNCESVHIIKGWFEETLPGTTVQPIALLHIDSDWYESVRICLETFYDSVPPGGIIIIDDYGLWGGCRKAVDEFFGAKGLKDVLKPSGRTAVYFVKAPSCTTPAHEP